MQPQTGQEAPRRIPATPEDLDRIIAIAKHAYSGMEVVRSSELVPTGALITLYADGNTAAVIALLNASGYTAREVAGKTITVTGVLSRLEILRAERDRLDAEIAAEEERRRAAIAAA